MSEQIGGIADESLGGNAGGGIVDAPSPRKRGRPSNAEIAARAAAAGGAEPDRIDPATIGSNPADGNSDTGTRTRGRPRKSTAAPSPVSVDSLIVLLSVAQLGAASQTGIPEFMLSPDQTKMLAEASARVARHFPAVLTEKQQDIAALLVAVGQVGWAQFSAYKTRIAAEKQVVPFARNAN